MSTSTASRIEISDELVDAIRSFPTERLIEHCGKSSVISPFALYYRCPACGKDVKVRAFSATPDIEDVFDAVFEWISSPSAASLVEERRRVFESDKDD